MVLEIIEKLARYCGGTPMRRRQTRPWIFAIAIALWAMPTTARDQQGSASTDGLHDLEDWKSADVQITGHVLEPRQLEPTEERLARLNLPDGFEIEVFARDLINSRMLAIAQDGTAAFANRQHCHARSRWSFCLVR
jgi:hypothetical protein